MLTEGADNSDTFNPNPLYFSALISFPPNDTPHVGTGTLIEVVLSKSFKSPKDNFPLYSFE